MSIFNTSDKEIEIKGFINKNDILKYVTEEDIFELVFGFKPKEYQYVTSPFRKDTRPGCWFGFSPYSNKLKFVDFGSQIYINGRRMINIDCFDAVQKYFKLNNLYETLNFIKNHLIKGKDLPQIEHKTFVSKVKKNVKINFDVRPFNDTDRRYWQKYEITSANLIEDKVFAVKRFNIVNGKNGNYSSRTYDLCYAYTEFENNKKKIYRPFQKGKYRFISNCNQNDIGGILSLPDYGNLLTITKSYKDWRVLKNQGVNAVWFQNEGMIPDYEILVNLISRFDRVKVFYDNDETGIEASIKVSEEINSIFPGKATPLHLPKDYLRKSIKDPSDLISKDKTSLLKFLKQHNIIL